VAITGGARGIGRATARAFAAAGAKVAIGDVDADLAQRTAGELGGSVSAHGLDVCERESFERFVDAAESVHGGLDVLVNNAGVMPLGPLLEEDDRTARRTIEVNCHGTLNGMKVALPRFVARGSGHVVNLASIVGRIGVLGLATYSGTKHFVLGVSEAARLELRGTNVDISCVVPGAVNTELAAGIAYARFPRSVEPEEVAAAVVRVVARPRFEVFVPRSIGLITRIAPLLPPRVRDASTRVLQGDRALADTDFAARRAYGERSFL
jgi:NADP-dependent 3-hydroxy acid dehydrogenase YdfG